MTFVDILSSSGSISQRVVPAFHTPSILNFCYLGIVLVGTGSWMFHMTLLYPMQLLDELPMIYGSSMIIYTNHDLILTHMRRSRMRVSATFANKRLLLCALAAYCALVTVVYCFVWKNPVFHEVAYGLMVATMIGQTVLVVRYYRVSPRIYFFTVFYFFLGFLLWNVDNKLCTQLNAYRRHIDWLVAPSRLGATAGSVLFVVLRVVAVSLKALSEFHSWWHVFTGYSSFVSLLFLTEVYYQNYLIENDLLPTAASSLARPVACKYAGMYYYLDCDILDDTRRQHTSIQLLEDPDKQRDDKLKSK